MTHTTKHTPGPWVVNTFIVNGQHKLEVLDATGANACVQANAHLIAAAPAMYEALQFVREFYQIHFDIMPVAFQTVDNICATALAQAEGRQG